MPRQCYTLAFVYSKILYIAWCHYVKIQASLADRPPAPSATDNTYSNEPQASSSAEPPTQYPHRSRSLAATQTTGGDSTAATAAKHAAKSRRREFKAVYLTSVCFRNSRAVAVKLRTL